MRMRTCYTPGQRPPPQDTHRRTTPMVRTTHSHSTKTPHETATATTPAMPSLPMPAPQMVDTPVGRRERQPLRAWRERADDGRGWSQDTLARKASAVAEQRGAELGWDKTAVTVSAVAAIEQGRARPTLDTALILAETPGPPGPQNAWPPLAE